MLTLTKSLSEFFQRPKIDLKTAQGLLEDLKKKLQRRRKLSDQTFSTLYKDEILPLAESLDVDIKMPRIVKNQKHRNNTNAESPEVYFRRTVYIPLLDYVIQDLEFRFSKDVLQLYNFSCLFPTGPTELESEEIQSAIASISSKYSHFFNQPEELLRKNINGELSYWYGQWARSPNTGELTAIELFDKCDKDIYPCLRKLLRIFLSLPISNATAERTFSCLRRIKSWLRSTMSEDRLIGLALLHIHRNIPVTTQEILDLFATEKRRVDFVV